MYLNHYKHKCLSSKTSFNVQFITTRKTIKNIFLVLDIKFISIEYYVLFLHFIRYEL